MNKGINRETLDEMFRKIKENSADSQGMHDNNEQINSEQERLRAIIAKKGELSRYKSDPNKFKQYLLRQGFSYGDIRSALNHETN